MLLVDRLETVLRNFEIADFAKRHVFFSHYRKKRHLENIFRNAQHDGIQRPTPVTELNSQEVTIGSAFILHAHNDVSQIGVLDGISCFCHNCRRPDRKQLFEQHSDSHAYHRIAPLLSSNYLTIQQDEKWPLEQCRKALENPGMDGTTPEARWQMLNAPLNAIKRAVRRGGLLML
jgi:hypothetical protein